MDGNTLIQAPSGSALLWALKNPDAVMAAVDKINRQQNLQVRLVAPGGDNQFPLRPMDSPGGMTLGLPLMFPVGYGVPTGTVSRAAFAVSSVSTADLAARVAALIQDLQRVGIAPSL